MSTLKRTISDGIVTHIQRFSVHDGPGIRTTVFLKGCQLHCPWCHNPETYRAQPELQVFAQRCIGCGACIARCPNQAREIQGGRYLYHRERCVACGRCAEACYARSLVVAGKHMTAEQVLDEILADRAFYDPVGGATLSGGEPLAQPAFCRAILERCRESGVHTALETNLAWDWSCVAPLAPLVDLFLVDLKLLDDQQHRTWTGMSNRLVLENLQRLGAEGRSVTVRTPVIAGVNDRPEQIEAIARWIAQLPNVRHYELLPYHPLGSGKHEALGLAPPRASFAAPSPAEMHQLAARAAQERLEVKVVGLPAPRGSNGSQRLL